MAKSISFVIDPEDVAALAEQRYDHPHPRVRKRCWLLWLVSHGYPLAVAAKIAGVSSVTAWRYGVDYREGGLDATLEERWHGQPGDLVPHAETLAAAFAAQPPRTVAEAAQRIFELTSIRRGHTQVREFLRDRLGLTWRRTASVPCPPKKTSPTMSPTRTDS